MARVGDVKWNRVEHQPGCADALMWPDSRAHTVGLGTKTERVCYVCETCGASSAWMPVGLGRKKK